MSETNVEKMSASRLALIIACPRKYIFKYVMGLADPSSKALGIGKAFHEILEGKNPSAVEHGIDECDIGVVQKMAKNHAFITRSLPPVKFKEVKFETPTLLGFLDAIRIRDTGSWAIAERKTAGDLSRLETIRRDLQLCTYAASKSVVAETCKLDPDKFDGFYYEVTLKPSERIKKNETPTEFVSRCSVMTEVARIEPSEQKGMADHFYQQSGYALKLRDIALERYNAWNDPLSVPCNQSSCKMFNQKCAFFERCYGEVK